MISRGAVGAAFLSALVLIITQAGLYRGSVEQERAAQWVVHSYQVIQELESIATGISVAEASLRGFTLTEDHSALSAFRAGLARAESSFSQALMQTADNASQGRSAIRCSRPLLPGC